MSKAKSKVAKGREEEETGDDSQQGGDEPQQVEVGESSGTEALAALGSNLQDTPRPTFSSSEKTGSRDDEQETEVAKIAKQVGKKMKLEINAKVKEMQSLKYQREAAVNKVKRLSRKIEAGQYSADQESEFLAKHEKDDELDRKKLKNLKKLESDRIRQWYDLRCQKHLAKRKEIAKIQVARKAVISKHRDNLIEKAATQRALKEELEETNKHIQKLEIKMEDLPSDPGFSPDVISLLDDQIATRRKELECPVCLEEAAPPIYSCVAQHLVCAKCRLVHPEMHLFRILSI